MTARLGAVLCMALSAAGCADKSAEIPASYVSPVAYQQFSCRQISEEAARIASRASTVMGQQDKQASNDATATAVSLVLFWPAAFFIKGNKNGAAEVARLKGEMEALEQVSIAKNCGITFQRRAATAEEKAEMAK